MQIMGDDFVKKVKLKQEEEEIQKKINQLDETRVSMGNINLTNNLNNAYKNLNESDSNEMDRLQKNIEFEDINHEFDNIVLNQPPVNNEDNKKKYLILGIVLVVLFLLTIIIIRLLTGDSKKEDPFTSNNTNSSGMRTMEDSDKIEERYKRILDDNARKSENESISSTERLDQIKESTEQVPLKEIITQEDSISNETIDETIRKIEEKKSTPTSTSTQVPEVKKEQKVTPKPTVTTPTKPSIRDLVEGTSSKIGEELSSSTSGFFIQIGAFTKKPNDSYLQNILKEGFSYKIIQDNVKGTTFNKVLVGPYNSRAAAQSEVATLRSRLNIQNTFIVNQ